MPFVSRQQQKWGHTKAGEKALGGPAAVKEWDMATEKGSLSGKPNSQPKSKHPGVMIKVMKKIKKSY
jgi:hypothetical protein